MLYEIAETEMDETTDSLARELDRAFLTAHLLTGRRELAEAAIQEAIDSWDPEDEGLEMLSERVLRAALRESGEDPEIVTSEPALPDELEAVLQLSPRFRQCIVLRVMLGRSRDACAGLLGLAPERVDDDTCAALQCLAEQQLTGSSLRIPGHRRGL